MGRKRKFYGGGEGNAFGDGPSDDFLDMAATAERSGWTELAKEEKAEAVNLLEQGLDPFTGQPIEEQEATATEEPAEEEPAQGTDGRTAAEEVQMLRTMYEQTEAQADALAKALKEANERAERAEREAKEAQAKAEQATKEQAKAEASKEQPEAKTHKATEPRQTPASAEEAIKRAQNLVKIGHRLEAMKGKRDELETYIFGNSQTGEALSMKDANGQEFKSNNPVLIKKIKDLVLREIKSAIEEAEAEILAM